MTEAFDIIDSNVKFPYTFRFGISGKVVHLTQEQLDRIPYLSTLVIHKNDFSPITNANGEYVLHPLIDYILFTVILHCIISNESYILFNELPEDENILDALQLFDYLGIKSFPLPFLKNESLVQTNPLNTENGKENVEYHKANLSEARETAAELIIALSKNEYNLNDSNTAQRLLFLINAILVNSTVFSSRFRQHTLTVVKDCCYSFFSKKEQRQLPTTTQIVQRSKIDSLMYLYDNDNPLPDQFPNTFTWRGDLLRGKGEYIDHVPLSCGSISDWKHGDPQIEVDDIDLMSLRTSLHISMRELSDKILSIQSEIMKIQESIDILNDVLPIYSTNRNQTNNEIQLARSGRFHTLPERANVDKLKHRFNSKTQKYR